MKSKIIFIVLMVSILAGSCKKGFLDQIPDNILKEDEIFKSIANTRGYLAQVYTNMPDDFSCRFAPSDYSGPWTGASDEANYMSLDFVISNQLNQSTWGLGIGGTYWTNWYKPVRTATDFINKIDGANPAEVDALTRGHYKAEARAMRALFYFWMMRLYGPVIILDNQVPVNGVGDEIFFKRSTFDDCVSYVVGQLDSAYNEIKASVVGTRESADQPLTYGGIKEWGRITTGICKAYKVQVLMLAASPLFNGNKELASLKNKDGEQLINQTYDPNKWVLAVNAAKEFLNEFDNKTYRLYRESDSDPFVAAYKSCKNVIIKDRWDSEWIFGKAMANASSYMYDITPKLVGYDNSVVKGGGFLAVNQSMVDAYEMKNGRPITDPNSDYVNTGFSDFKAPYDVKARSTFNQWVNREPRFYVGVTYNKSYWQNQSGPVEVIPVFEKSGNSGRIQSLWDVTSTGYTVRKQLASSFDSRGWVHLRLAQIYLDYAEALNEADPGNPDIIKYVNLIRERAGVPEYGSGTGEKFFPAPSGQKDVREAIRHERMVELAFENVRYFDVRRWKIAAETMGADVYGMNVFADGNDFYKKTLIQKRRFLPRDYLWPIPNTEILKDKYLVQNPGWQ